MNLRGTRAVASFSSEPDVKAWTDEVALNPARVPPGHGDEVDDALTRLRAAVRDGLPRLAELSAEPR
jgi:hypothetical protein